MSVTAHTATPKALLKSLTDKIADGTIGSWIVDSEGDFCHQAAQLKGQCCFKPSMVIGALHFNVRWYQGVVKDPELAAQLHGHAVRMLMVHGPDQVTSITVPIT